jgi:hypothetical protein
MPHHRHQEFVKFLVIAHVPAAMLNLREAFQRG